MKDRVDQGNETGRSIRKERNNQPPDGKHARMVVDVQERDLVELFAQYEEYRVQELEALAHVKQPQYLVHLTRPKKLAFLYII
jgi:hypothetical protein